MRQPSDNNLDHKSDQTKPKFFLRRICGLLLNKSFALTKIDPCCLGLSCETSRNANVFLMVRAAERGTGGAICSRASGSKGPHNFRFLTL